MVLYVDPIKGNDLNSGKSPHRAWKTLARVSRGVFQPGARILLKRGGVWNESLRLQGHASAANPILLGSYSAGGRPRINGGVGHAITANRAISGWIIEGLELTSTNNLNPSRKIEGGTCGIYFNQEEKCDSLIIRDCLVHDTSGPGIFLEATGEPKAVFRDVVVEKCEVFRASAGIAFTAHPIHSVEFFPNFKITNCLVHDIGGDGIVPFCGRDGVVEYCKAYRTGLGVAPSDHSPVAIWFAWAKNCVIQFCEAYDNHPGGHEADGGGFDIDGGCEGCVLQYNYSHDNDGAGYLICSWDPYTWPNRGAICRFNISVNDGLKNNHSSLRYYFADDAKVYNNTCITRTTIPVIFASETRGHLLANNIFCIESNEDIPFVLAEFNIMSNEFKNNLYFRISGAPSFEIQGKGRLTLEEFIELVGAEGQIGGDPRFINSAGNDFRLLPDSPCRGAGSRLPEMGKQDYYGTKLEDAGPVDIGCALAGE